MKLQSFSLTEFEIPLISGQIRKGILIHLRNEDGKETVGEIAPLPKWSHESLEDAFLQLHQKSSEILNIYWSLESCFSDIAKLDLLPSVHFGLESALLSLLDPLSDFIVNASALLMGSPAEILEQANQRLLEGFKSAKLKVGHLKFDEAFTLIHQLKDKFHLRIDVNRAWTTFDSLDFFAQFSLDTFDYVEEPFQNPHDLAKFQHPLGIDESYPNDLSLKQLTLLPTLKALIYKPTIQGGLSSCLELHNFTTKNKLSLVLSSSFESDIGLCLVASIAHRLDLTAPIGIGTFHHLSHYLSDHPLQFINSVAYVPEKFNLKKP